MIASAGSLAEQVQIVSRDIESICSSVSSSRSLVVSIAEAAARHFPDKSALVFGEGTIQRLECEELELDATVTWQERVFHVKVFGHGHYETQGQGHSWCCHGNCLRIRTFVTFPRHNRGDVLRSGESLGAYDLLTSPNNKYIAIMQFDGNFVIYARCMPNPWGEGATWATNTCERGQYPHTLKLQEDGNMLLTDATGQRMWQSRTAGRGTAPFRLCMQDNGTLALYDAGERAIWDHGDGWHPGFHDEVGSDEDHDYEDYGDEDGGAEEFE
ncbi:hypothetical protein HYH03_010122 [Edaphochlamys debaryana]|uniref:Bulb-type lectin domain-containing protein n=1 Tax=Edaphochlamys debaryana TaxID=47281 RepID=A0A835XWL0_9CHLO|nr:hypothetical protein HYH03_010122 [Edaphochlamys debaryana]|eukprot:KAG2491553.1 hypothetical protein HYH03_010122 [Edaphochlamys debaryana]